MNGMVKACAAAACAILAVSTACQAATLQFSFETSKVITGDAITASGTFTYVLPPSEGSVLSVSGTINGQAITGLTSLDLNYYDPTTDTLLLSVEAGAIDYIFGGVPFGAESTNFDQVLGSFTILPLAPVGLPGSLSLLGSALVLLGAGMAAQRRARLAVSAA